MTRIVMKFGGTSVASVSHIKNVAAIVASEARAGHQTAVVLSAMAGETDKLIGYCQEIAPHGISPEHDVVLASGEQVTAGLLAMVLQSMGLQARSWLGWQLPIYTTQPHGRARIDTIEVVDMLAAMQAGEIVVIPGFQGLMSDGRLATLGRGGSDTSAVAIAAAISADRCDIYTDVEGVYTSDPRIVTRARKLDYITYEEMLELASVGAKVLQTRSVELAMKQSVRIRVLSSFTSNDGCEDNISKDGAEDNISKDGAEDNTENNTNSTDSAENSADRASKSPLGNSSAQPHTTQIGTMIVSDEEIEELAMERHLITGIAHNKNEAKVTLTRVPDQPGAVAQIFDRLAEHNINVDMIIQNVGRDKGETDVTFTVTQEDLPRTTSMLEKVRAEIGFNRLLADDKVAKVSVVGVGMKSHAGVASTMFRTLAERAINIQAISTSEIKVSVLIDEDETELAMRLLHSAYSLDVDLPAGEAQSESNQ